VPLPFSKLLTAHLPPPHHSLEQARQPTACPPSHLRFTLSNKLVLTRPRTSGSATFEIPRSRQLLASHFWSPCPIPPPPPPWPGAMVPTMKLLVWEPVPPPSSRPLSLCSLPLHPTRLTARQTSRQSCAPRKLARDREEKIERPALKPFFFWY
jgi:hypothetical protein